MPRKNITVGRSAYEWREGCAWAKTADAQAIGERIEQLAESVGGGVVTPEMIVADAESTKSPFHNLIEWDDARAADSHRRQQARQITASITVVRVVPGDGRQQTRAFVSVVHRNDHDERGYVHVSRTSGYDTESKAKAELIAWCRRWAGVKELRHLVDDVYTIVEPQPISASRRQARSA